MPSLFKDPRGKSPFWYVAYRTPSGKRISKSTKTSDRRKALEIALNLERAEREAAEGDLTESRVRELLNDTMERTLGRRIQQMTIRVWFTKWLSDKETDGNLSENSRIAYAATIRLFLEHLGKRADDDLEQVQVDDVEHFKHRRIASGLSAKTIDRDLKVLRAILKQARLHGLINRDPAHLVPLVTKQGKRATQTVTREIFNVGELNAVTDASSGDWRTAIMLARYTGARQGDCVRMRWEHVDLTEKVIRYSDAKTQKRYVVPIHAALERHLRELAKSQGTQKFLCPTLSVKKSGGKYGLSAGFRHLMKQAGVDDRTVTTKAIQSVAGKERHLARRSFHSLRHTYNSQLANTGTNQEIRRKLIGHSTDDMNDVYTHLETGVFRQAIERLP